MRSSAFTEEEISAILKALFVSKTKQDARAVWAVLDRRRTGTIARSELQELLIGIFGAAHRRQLNRLLDRLPSASSHAAL